MCDSNSFEARTKMSAENTSWGLAYNLQILSSQIIITLAKQVTQ